MTRMTRLLLCLVVSTAASTAEGCHTERHFIGIGPGAGVGGSADRGTGGVASPPGSGGVSGQAADAGLGAETAPTAPRALPLGARNAVTAVARLLWESAPDAALLATADSGSVETSEDLRRLALTMLADPRAETGVQSFFRWWLDLDQIAQIQADPVSSPQFTPELAMAMSAETQMFGAFVTLDGDGLFSTLLTADFTFINEALAAVYHLDGVTGPALRRVSLDPSQRQGLLMQPGQIVGRGPILTSRVPTLRGKFIAEHVLCQPIPQPPPAPPEAPFGPTVTIRQAVTPLTTSACAVACHAMVDPLGFSLGHFDSIGQYQATENGLVIDASGSLALQDGTALSFDGAPALVAALANLPEARACISQKWLEYAVGHGLTSADDLAVADAYGWFSSSGFNLRALIAGVTQTDLFLHHPAVCTPGADQTCNDNPALSSLHGHCTDGLRCACTIGVASPQTGRCL